MSTPEILMLSALGALVIGLIVSRLVKRASRQSGHSERDRK